MGKRPTLSTRRAVEIFEEALSVRRLFCGDGEFFRMTDFWQHLCDKEGRWKINAYGSSQNDDFKRKAGVIAFQDRATLTVDERLWEGARRGTLFFNFMLAHEAGHLMLDHHAKGAVTKHFQLFGPTGLSNVPPTDEELETNYAAVFLQCGVALLDDRWTALELARRAHCDPLYVEKALRAVRVPEFQRLLNRPRPKRERVIL